MSRRAYIMCWAVTFLAATLGVVYALSWNRFDIRYWIAVAGAVLGLLAAWYIDRRRRKRFGELAHLHRRDWL